MASTKLVALWPYWMTENQFRSHFSLFQINTHIFFFSQNDPRWPFWMTENHFRSHFFPFQINTQLFFKFTKWPPILDDRKSLSIAFLAISDQYATFFGFKFLFQNGRRRPYWKFDLGHFGWPKITFNRISRHFRSIKTQYKPYYISPLSILTSIQIMPNNMVISPSPRQYKHKLLSFNEYCVTNLAFVYLIFSSASWKAAELVRRPWSVVRPSVANKLFT